METKNLQKKLIDYAAVKITKKLDKRIAKAAANRQSLEPSQHNNVKYSALNENHSNNTFDDNELENSFHANTPSNDLNTSNGQNCQIYLANERQNKICFKKTKSLKKNNIDSSDQNHSNSLMNNHGKINASDVEDTYNNNIGNGVVDVNNDTSVKYDSRSKIKNNAKQYQYSSDNEDDYQTAGDDDDDDGGGEYGDDDEFHFNNNKDVELKELNKKINSEEKVNPNDLNEKDILNPHLNPTNKTAFSGGAVHSPGVGHPSGSSSPDYSGYIQKKSLAQGMMDLALLSANTNQLRYIIEYRDNHPYFTTSVTLVIASLFLQIAVGLTLIWNTKFNVKKKNEMLEADRVNNFGVIGIFLVTLINVFLSTFGGAPTSKPPDLAAAAIITSTSPIIDSIVETTAQTLA